MSNEVDIEAARNALKNKFDSLAEKRQILRDSTIKDLFAAIKDTAPDKRGQLGAEINSLKNELLGWVNEHEAAQADSELSLIDVTAPFGVNTPKDQRPKLLTMDNGSKHPLSAELEVIADIFLKMGFTVEDSRQLDDEYHMFTALNFPEDHPARDDYDTFLTEDGLIPPAHTSTMQNRILRKYEPPIRAVIPGRVFRNEDLDARHEHTFHQVEGVYVDKGIALSDMLGTIKKFLETYFSQDLEFKTQPFYFPFVEPGLEYLISCPFCKKKGCNVCSYSGWMEIMGCGMIHPEVLKAGGIDPEVYSGFAWGFGVERLVMVKHGIEDVRHFHSGNLEFLRKFK